MAIPETGKPSEGQKAREAEAEDLHARLEALKAKLGEANAAEDARKTGPRGRKDDSAIGVGMRAGSELIAGVLVGGGIGYVLDAQFETSPILLIIFLMFGFGAGFWNIYRMSLGQGTSGSGK